MKDLGEAEFKGRFDGCTVIILLDLLGKLVEITVALFPLLLCIQFSISPLDLLGKLAVFADQLVKSLST